jgi:hypothetical protein
MISNTVDIWEVPLLYELEDGFLGQLIAWSILDTAYI